MYFCHVVIDMDSTLQKYTINPFQSMALITFMSDYGYSDHYIAAVKASILRANPSLHIIDISHHIEHFNIAHGSYVLNAVFREFPEGTVHLVSVDTLSSDKDPYIAIKLEEHYFVGKDNGLFGLISEQEASAIVVLPDLEKHPSAFPAKDIFAPAVAKLASGSSIHDLGQPLDTMKRMIGRQPRATKRQISGHVIRVDGYGNLITNIEQQVFTILNKKNEFNIIFGRESSNKINGYISQTGSGDCFVIFNSAGLLEIGINKGNASELLGLHYDSPVNVLFPDL